jgi:hypothetical protein
VKFLTIPDSIRVGQVALISSMVISYPLSIICLYRGYAAERVVVLRIHVDDLALLDGLSAYRSACYAGGFKKYVITCNINQTEK